MDDFEQRLKRQPLRQVPADWRREILAAARSAQPPHPASRGPHRSLLSTLNHQLSTLLWPHPKAWGALAAIWILIFAVNFSMPDETPAMAQKTSPPAPETVSELRQQRLLLTRSRIVILFQDVGLGIVQSCNGEIVDILRIRFGGLGFILRRSLGKVFPYIQNA